MGREELSSLGSADTLACDMVRLAGDCERTARWELLGGGRLY